MFKMELQWKEFNIDLSALDNKLRSDYSSYAGNQAHKVLELWFKEDISQEDKDAIQSYWDGIKKSHAIAKNYISRDEIKAEKELKKASAIAKLKALGLDDEEIEAFKG